MAYDDIAPDTAPDTAPDEPISAEPTTKPKTKRIQEKDIEQLEGWVGKEIARRQTSTHRKASERMWAEVDRQVAMEPMIRKDRDGNQVRNDWRAALELGKLSEALEIISGDVLRLTFPSPDTWFECHSKIDGGRDEKGMMMPPDAKAQTTVDNILRSMMAQQQRDAGLEDRFEASIKEALLHGSFVAVADYETRMRVDEGYKVQEDSLPVWQPHSMWNCYPDPSPSVVVGDLFYQGSMIVLSYLPRYKLERMTGTGWMSRRYKDVPKGHKFSSDDNIKEAEDEIELLCFYGDINIERAGDDLFFPNCKACFANGKLVYFAPSEFPYPPVIFRGYEKQDVRNPYFVSPLMKMSPMQKTGSVMLNRFIDAIELKNNPPGVYDETDPTFAADGGPRIEPGAMTGTRGTGRVSHFEVGDPGSALQGFRQTTDMMEAGLGVNSVRAGGVQSGAQTAFEVNKASQAANVRTLAFIRKAEAGLEAYLYMQHHLNKKYLKQYSYYNSDLDSPDYLTATKKELPEHVKFFVIGAKSVISEENRVAKTSQVTAFLLGNPLTAEKVNLDEVVKTMYQDAGISNPERLLNVESSMDPKVKKIMMAAKQKVDEAQQAAQGMVQKAQEEMKSLTEQLQAEKAKSAAMASNRQLDVQKLELERQKATADVQLKQAQFDAEQRQLNNTEQAEVVDRQMFAATLEPIAQSMLQAAQVMAAAAEKISAPREIKLLDDGAGKLVGAVSVIVPQIDTVQ